MFSIFTFSKKKKGENFTKLEIYLAEVLTERPEKNETSHESSQ